MKINVVVKKSNSEYLDYMQHYRSDMLNVFIGGRRSGKTHSIDVFLSQTLARRDYTIDEYEATDKGFVLYRHTSTTLITGLRPRKPELVWFKKGDVITLIPNHSKEVANLIDNILTDENVKYTTFIH